MEHLSRWELCEGSLEGGLFYWGPLNKALDNGCFFYRGPILGNMEGCSFPRKFEKSVRFFYQENFCWGIQETCKRRLWKWATPCIWGPVGGPGGGGFIYCGLGDTLIFGLFFLDPEYVRSLSPGAFCNFSKGPGLP